MMPGSVASINFQLVGGLSEIERFTRAPRERKIQIDIRFGNCVIADRLPGDQRNRRCVGSLSLQVFEKMRKQLIVPSFKRIVMHSMLVGPDTRQDARPAGPTNSVIFLVTLSKYFCGVSKCSIFDQGVKMRRFSFLECIGA